MSSAHTTVCSILSANKSSPPDSSANVSAKDVLSDEPPLEEARETTDSPPFTLPTENDSVEKYLNPQLFEDPETIRDIMDRIRAGHAVVIRNAFRTEFAEAMHEALINNLDTFQLHQVYEEDSSFSCSHHNIYSTEDYLEIMNRTQDMLNSDESIRFFEELSGRDCSDGTYSTASYYKPGDHSLPHTDYYGPRTLAYVWHLTKDWNTGWGGHLYWANEHASNAFLDPSFNTLVLFSVTAMSHHMVTAVSPEAEGHRLTINGWYTDEWLPSWDEEWEDEFESEEDYFSITDDQYMAMKETAEECFLSATEYGLSEEVASARCEKITELVDEINALFDPPFEQVSMVELDS